MGKDIEQQETTLPHSTEAEEAVLAGVMQDPTQLDTLGLTPGDFYHAWNREIFRSMRALHKDGKPITWVHMYERLIGQPGNPNTPGEEYIDVTYLREVFDSTISAVHIHADAALVREKSIKRSLLVQVAQITRKAMNGTKLADLDAMLTEAREGLKEDEPEAALFTSIGELLDMEDKPIPWAVHEMLPHGALTIIAAEPGAGKSTWLRDLAVCVAKGQDFQGRAVKQGPVLLFSLEEYKPMVAEHMRKMGATHDDPLHIRFDPLDDAVSQVRAAVERLKPAMVIIDPLPKFTLIDDLNSYGQVSPAMDALVQLAHEGDGTNIVVVTHTNKNDEDKRPGGSIAFAASADVILHLAVEGENRRRVLSGVKNRFDERYLFPATVLGLNDTGHIESLGPKSEAVYKTIAGDMLAVLQAGPMLQPELLAAVTGKTGDKSKTVIRLEEVGKIKRERNGKGYLCSVIERADTQSNSSSPSLRFPGSGEALNMPALPLPPLIEGGRGRANEVEEKPLSIEERADAALHDETVLSLIEVYWPEDKTATPAEDTPAYHAQRLAVLVMQREAVAEGEAGQQWPGPYNPEQNAIDLVWHLDALLAELKMPPRVPLVKDKAGRFVSANNVNQEEVNA